MRAQDDDVFLSYRRSDAGAFAHLLYTDLERLGYRVFYDHQTLGAGDYVQNIRDQVANCKDYLILLSNDALGKRLADPDDVLHLELSEAIRSRKNIVGIFLPGFEGFPDDLPEDVAPLPSYNCLSAQMEYYDAMISRLTSGRFLDSTPDASTGPTMDAIPESAFEGKRKALEWFRMLPPQERRDYMRLVIQLANDFNSSPEMMRLYKYIDCCDRLQGIAEPPAYDGVMPTDVVTYLNFFENLYLLLATDTIHLPIIDDTYRFRFFSACNSVLVQESELLDLGYQYPNILALYDYWREYLRQQNESDVPTRAISDVIFGFDRDLHVSHRVYELAYDLNGSQVIDFIDRCFHKCTLTLRRLHADDLERCMELQAAVSVDIPDNDELNVFEAVTEREMVHSLSHDVCIGYFDSGRLVAQMNFIPDPDPGQDLLGSVRDEAGVDLAGVIDLCIVAGEYRGFGLQRSMIKLAKFLARRYDTPAVLATVSPHNLPSARNFIKEGFRVLARVPKYRSERDFFFFPIAK